MHWQEAISKSNIGRAFRVSVDGIFKYTIYKNGLYDKEHCDLGYVECRPDEILGFTDWEPINYKVVLDMEEEFRSRTLKRNKSN